MGTLDQKDLTYIFTTLFENLESQVTVLFTCFTLLTVALQCELFQNYGKLFNSTLRKQANSCELKLDTDQDTLESLSNLEKKGFYFNLDARFRSFLEAAVLRTSTMTPYNELSNIFEIFLKAVNLLIFKCVHHQPCQRNSSPPRVVSQDPPT